MARNIFKGLGIALITPFTADGEVDYKSLKRLVEYQLDNGADFLCILATTGEAPCLSTAEKDEITELIKKKIFYLICQSQNESGVDAGQL